MDVCCECCVLSGRGLCDELITRPEESYWLWCVVLCDLETSRMRRSWPALGRRATEKKTLLNVWVCSAWPKHVVFIENTLISFVAEGNTYVSFNMIYLNVMNFIKTVQS
jgi:hypothetical protein